METEIFSLLGGCLIGLAATGLLLWNGRVAGVSGILNRILLLRSGDVGWRISFVLGLMFMGALLFRLKPEWFAQKDFPMSYVAIAGLLVGFGTTLGNGCTSGHGICGVARLSKRSIVATVVFVLTGMITVFILRQIGVLG